MSEFRSFGIQNDAGQGYDLDGKTGIFFYTPSGLGMQDDIKTAELDYGFYHDLKNKIVPQNSIAGELLFINGSPYDLYREFISFVARSNKLILSYKPYGSEKFYCRGRFEYLQKSELEETGVLRVPVSFIQFTPWYLPKESTLRMRELTGGEMKYSFTFDSEETSDLIYASPLVGSYSVELVPNGHIDASIVFTYPGAIENPVLTLRGSNTNMLYGQCEVIANVTGFEFSSLYSDSYIIDSSGNSLLNGVSPDYNPFFHMPLHEPCILTLTADNVLSETASVKTYYFYRSV